MVGIKELSVGFGGGRGNCRLVLVGIGSGELSVCFGGDRVGGTIR